MRSRVGATHRPLSERRSLAPWLLLASLCAAPAARTATAPVHKLQTPPLLPPSVRIPVEPLGFEPPSHLYLSYRVPSATLDFVDDTHLLFTFHQATLMRREEQEPEDDEDQTIAAFLLELPSGKVVERTTWRLHDKGRYLWSIGDGRFLERERNDLYLLDHSLTARQPYLKTAGAVLALELSPDRSRMLVQYEEPIPEHETAEAQPNEGDVTLASPPTLGPDAPSHRRKAHRVRMLVINTRLLQIEHTAILAHAIALPLVEGGYLDLAQDKGKQWKVMLRAFGGQPRAIAQLTSSCQPTLQPLNQQVYMAELCIPYTTDHLMQAYDLDGKKLWEQQWETRYVWGSYAYAQNGSRFAYESIQLDHPIATLDPVDETWITGQPIGVFDVADGNLRIVAGAQPILSAGQNFALSADGERFAVLRGGAIEVYQMPPAARALNAHREASAPTR